MNFYEFFGLKENPFTDTKDVRYFYPSQEHLESLTKIKSIIEDRQALGALYGEVGTGKSFLCQKVISELEPAKYSIGIILCTQEYRPRLLLEKTLDNLGAQMPASQTVYHLIEGVKEFAFRSVEIGKRVVLFFDEAQWLCSNSLHILKALSNLEIETTKLVTSFLVGETRLHKRLRHRTYNSLRSRVYLPTVLAPLNSKEIPSYVSYRLKVAGYKGKQGIFHPDVFSLIQKHSQGIPRGINRLAQSSLISAFVERSPTVRKKHILKAIKEVT